MVRWNPLSKIGVPVFVAVSPMLYHIPSIWYCDSFKIYGAGGLCLRCKDKIASFIFSSLKKKVMPCYWTGSFKSIPKIIMSPLSWCAYIFSFRSNKNYYRGFCCTGSDLVCCSYTFYTPSIEGLHGQYADIIMITLSFPGNLF